MENEAEAKIIEACLAGDGRSYAALVRRYGKPVYAICLGMTGNSADAEDMTQETFMRGFTGLSSLRDRDRFGPWISTIAGNLCRNFIKKRKSQQLHRAMAIDCPGEAHDDVSGLHEALGRLPEKYRIPLMQYYFDGHSTENVAALLGVSCEAVHTRLSRARRELRKLLESEGGTR